MLLASPAFFINKEKKKKKKKCPAESIPCSWDVFQKTSTQG